jgi:saccharopine dehydrogenase-like NADP-dependent oxidoreductase
MNVVVLGAAGEVGKTLTADLGACPEIDHVIAADLARDEVEALAAGRERVSAAPVNLRDREQVLRLLHGCDLLVNCTSFSLFDVVIDLAMSAGIDYADLLSYPSQEQVRAVEESGITAISGLGLTPGLSNVLVAHAADELDEIEEAHIAWMSFRTIAPSRGLLDTILWELSEDCSTREYFQNGRFHQAGPMEGSRLVDFADPAGRQRVYFVPHTEVRTLPRHFPSLAFCAVRGTWRPKLMDDVRVLNEYGLLNQATLEATKEVVWDRFGGERDVAPWMLFLNVEVVGTQNGETVRRVYDVSHPTDWNQAATGRMTGLCAAVGAQLLARHGRTHAGFVDPEVYYDPHEFLVELARREGVSVARRDSILSGQPLERAT